MGEKDGSAVDGVRAWVENSGRALELRVAREFRRQGAVAVGLSFPYTDPVTSARREGDVRASFQWDTQLGFPGYLRVIAECKSSVKHPWVAFYDGRRVLTSTSRLDVWTYSHNSPDTRATEPLVAMWIGQEPFHDLIAATHVAAAHSGEVNPAGDAVRQVLAATEAERKRYIATQETRRALVLVPIVVTSAPMFRCSLDSDGELEIAPIHIFPVLGDAGDRGQRRVYVMNESLMAEFARQCQAAAGRAGEQARFPR